MTNFLTELFPRGLGLRDDSGQWWMGPTLGHLLLLAAYAFIAFGAATLVRRQRFAAPIVAGFAGLPLLGLYKHLAFFGDGRYFEPFVVPAAIALTAGFAGLTNLPGVARVTGRFVAPMVCALLIGWIAVANVPWARARLKGPARDPQIAIASTVRFLDDHGVHFVRGGYWAVYRVTYRSGLRILGASDVAIRFPYQQRAAEAAPNEEVGFVFASNAENPSALTRPIAEYDRAVFDDIVVYAPKRA